MSQNPSSKEKSITLEIPKRNQSCRKFQRETTVPERNQHLYIEFWSGYFGIFGTFLFSYLKLLKKNKKGKKKKKNLKISINYSQYF